MSLNPVLDFTKARQVLTALAIVALTACSSPPVAGGSSGGTNGDSLLCDGKWVNAQTDTHQCGGCGNDCSTLPGVDPAAVQCVDGACVLACLPGRAHCTADVSSGCETDLSNPETCGSCTTACAEPTPACAPTAEGFACASGCSEPASTRCNATCVDTTSNVNDCGGCGNDCTALPGVDPAAVQCVNGACVLACLPGRAHCTGDVSSGCETDLSNPESCGSCTTACAEPTPVCAPTPDSFACASGCSEPAPTRCNDTCVDTTSNVNDCGGCGNDCTALPGVDPAAVQCVNGACVLACLPGRAHCTGDVSSGCETDLSNPDTCGSCTTACAEPTPVCAATPDSFACGSGCSEPASTRCNGTCVDPTSNVNDCGGCGNVCAGDAHGSSVCTGGTCGLACESGFMVCG